MIIVLDSAGNILCYLFTQADHDRFAAAIPDDLQLAYRVFPAFTQR